MASTKYPRGIRYHRGGWELRFRFQKESFIYRFTAAENKTNLDRAKRLLKQAKSNLLEDIEPWPDIGSVYAGTDNPEFREVAKMWLKNLAPRTSKSHFEDVRNIVNNVWLDQFDGRHVANITPKQIKRNINAIAWSGNQRKKNCMSVLRQIFEYAIDEMDYIDINPVPRFKAPKTKTRQRAKPFTRVEKSAILDAIKELRTDAWLFYFLSFETGMRTGEVLALHWNDFDFVGGTVAVDKAMVRRRLKSTKTGSGRTVILTRAAQAALTKFPRPIKGGAVFLNAKGTIMKDADHFVSAFNSAIKKTGILYRRPYTTRSTRATELLAAGVPVKIVADQLGHTEQVCHDRYSGLYVTGEEQVVLHGAEDLMEVWRKKDDELRKSGKDSNCYD